MVKERCNSAFLSLFCEVYIPLAPSVFTYGVPEGVKIVRGSVVWVQLARRKPTLALVSRVHSEKPDFDVRYACPHESGYVFSERYMESLEWVAKYYVSTPMRTLNVFWPADFDKYLDALFAEKNAEPRGEAPSAEPEMTACSDLPPLTEEQGTALASLVEDLDKSGFRGTLLHGVTGSGKTRVYQELVREALKRGKRVLILVPEIGLTPQTASRFEDYLKVPVVVLHSALSAPQKRAGYLAVLDGSA
ncbi:MAG: DEAD/DEAH box helicase family protein, partial [Fibrobacter sp.]|nr:DEAD/DEAH box helicase family protein [Fibrobacter sp.]